MSIFGKKKKKTILLRHHEVNETGDFTYGPFSISPSSQGNGFGKKLILHVEDIGRKKGFKSVLIDVVNHRTDLIPW